MTYYEFISAFRQAYEHKPGLKMLACGKLEAEWFKQIQREVSWITENSEPSNVGSKRHVTYWTRPRGEARQFSLLNRTGNTDDYSADHSFETEGKKLVFPQLEAIARFSRLFGPGIINLRLNGLGRSSGLGAHEERPISPKAFSSRYKIRFHLPIYTNAGAKICLDAEQFHFEAGVLYFFNQGCVHAAINEGEEPRYHFVLDVLLSRDLHRRMFLQDSNKSPDPGFIPFSSEMAEGYQKPELWNFGDFTTENGRLMTRMDYGRIAPTPLDYHLNRRPRLYSIFGRLFGRSRVNSGM